MKAEAGYIRIAHTAKVMILLTGDTADGNNWNGNMGYAVETALKKAGLRLDRIHIRLSEKRATVLCFHKAGKGT